MALFLSTFINKIDKKGRVSVPASFRIVLAEQSFKGIIVYNSFINPCIEACGMERIERIYKMIDNLETYSVTRDAFATVILGGSTQLPFDSEGRIILPPEVMDKAHLSDQICFVGKGETFEIWHPQKFQEHIMKVRQIAQDNRDILNFRLKDPL